MSRRYMVTLFVMLTLVAPTGALTLGPDVSVLAQSVDLEYVQTLSEHSEWCSEADSASYGSSLAIGRVDSDVFGDIVVGDRGNERIYVHYGSAQGSTYGYPSVLDDYGDLTTANLNDDQFSDIVVGFGGEVTVYYGRADRDALGNDPWIGQVSETAVPTLVARLGDANGDGVDDIAVGLPDEEKAYVFYGFEQAGDEPRGPIPVPYAVFENARGHAGDVNGDGHPDFIGTTPGSGTTQPKVFVSLGPAKKTLWAWGYNHYGQLGNGNTDDQHSPTPIGSDNDWVEIATGSHHSLALKSDGSLWAWGNSHYGQLGNGNTDDQHSPTPIGSDNDWVSVAGGYYHSLGLKSDGSLWVWGLNYFGQLGIGNTDDQHSPTPIGSDNDWVSVAGGYYHSLGLKSDGSLWAWGYNYHGQLGIGNTDDQHSPTPIGSDNDWVEIATGSFHSLALKADRSLWAWGYNHYGQLGNGNTDDQHSPTPIGSDNDWVEIATGRDYSLALKADGSLWVWGRNTYGQLGIGNTDDQHSPTPIGSDNDWVSVAGGYYHSLGLKSDGSLWAWGYNHYGQLGNGNTDDQHSPTPIGSDNDWVEIATGRDYSLALRWVDVEQAPDWFVEGIENETSAYFGDTVGSAGDINGDGYGDIIVTDPWHDGQPGNPGHYGFWGRFYIWLGGPPTVGDASGLGQNETPLTADIIKTGDYVNGASRTYAAGDINDDGYTDLAVGDRRGADYCFDDYSGQQQYAETGLVKIYRSGFAPPDTDEDGVPDDSDNCPGTYNPDQSDQDTDRHGDACDVCPRDPRDDQDGDLICEGEGYNSPKIGDRDNCPQVANQDQADGDDDGVGDACDPVDDRLRIYLPVILRND
jgi:alpha-tubulin suppressor-like RCC1 family protein